jgi:hypothetical protein
MKDNIVSLVKRNTMNNNTLVIITAQVHENYSDTDTPYWKAKMGQQFHLRTDANNFIYGEHAINAIQSMLDAESNSRMKFTYIEHELVFQEPINLDPEVFEQKVEESFKNANK